MRSDLAEFETVNEWRVQAACRTADPELFFRDAPGRVAADGIPAALRPALVICWGCPVARHCLQYALDHHPQWGIWGGTTQEQRKAMKPRRLQVVS